MNVFHDEISHIKIMTVIAAISNNWIMISETRGSFDN